MYTSHLIPHLKKDKRQKCQKRCNEFCILHQVKCMVLLSVFQVFFAYFLL